ncbi:MAG: hypothetical protein WCD21_16350 [Streptomyces sp.]
MAFTDWLEGAVMLVMVGALAYKFVGRLPVVFRDAGQAPPGGRCPQPASVGTLGSHEHS